MTANDTELSRGFPRKPAGTIRWGFVLATAMWLAGCGDSGSPFDYIQVSGQLVYEDGSPIGKDNMRVQFVSIDQSTVGQAHPRPALASLDREGRFESVTSYKYGDGLVPGKHKVAILDAEDPSGKLLVPLEYTNVNSSPLIISTEDLPLEIKVPKP